MKLLHEVAPMQQTRLLLPMIEQLLSDNALTLTDIDAIAYGCGPGSFTGIRIAVSVAQGLSFSANKPLIPISSLAILAQTAFSEGKGTHFCVSLDARMDQVYWAIYQVNSEGLVELQGKEEICAPSECKAPDQVTGIWSGVGDGWAKYPDELKKKCGNNTVKIYSQQLPVAEAIVKLALYQFQQGASTTAKEALPVYLR